MLTIFRIMTETFKIATWNVNSIRTRQEQVADWLQSNKINIALLQEIKCTNEQFPYEIFEDLGYNCYILGQKSYNGVAILSKLPVDEIEKTFKNNNISEQARFIEVALNLPIGYTRIISVYIPNGGEPASEKFESKLVFLDKFREYISKTISFDEHLIIGGDFNVALNDEDVYSKENLEGKTCFTIDERTKLRKLLNDVMIDLQKFYKADNIFTWWDYRGGSFQHNKGLRIDYIISSPSCTKYVKNYYVDKETRAVKKSSDHAPVILELQ